METKVCTHCQRALPLENFCKNKRRKDGLNNWCRECSKLYKKSYYGKNKEEILEAHKEYYKNHKEAERSYRERNKERIKLRKTEYRKTHREQERAQKKKWREENREKVRQQKRDSYQRLKNTSVKAWKEKNKEIILQKKKEYREKNAESIKMQRKAYRIKAKGKTRERYNNDIQFRLSVTLRHRISEAVKAQGAVKRERTAELIGCSIAELKKHLESQFKDGMSWENYGFYGWHIDHIIPCAAFDLSKEDEQKKCFNYKNLQPLWAVENNRKSDKMPDGKRASEK